MFNIALIDDQLSPPLGTGDNVGYHREMFLADVGTEKAHFFFCDGLDPFRKDYTATHALRQVRAIDARLDLIMIDLVFGHHLAMGFEIIDLLRKDEHFGAIPRILMSSRKRTELIAFDGADRTVGNVAQSLGTRYLNKDSLFRAGVFWRRVQDAIHSRVARD